MVFARLEQSKKVAYGVKGDMRDAGDVACMEVRCCNVLTVTRFRQDGTTRGECVVVIDEMVGLEML